jgi:AcrR family transcriptional regulator
MIATPQRDNDTRPRLIAAGARLFGEHNGHEVTSRMLAREAGVNHAAINYHFGGREGLCEAIFDHCLGEWTRVMRPVLEHARAELDEPCDAPRLAAVLHDLVQHMIRVLTGQEESRFLAVLFNEGLIEPPQFRRRLFDEVIQPFHTVAARLAGAARGLPEDDLESVVLGQTIVAQCMTFFRGRILLLPRLKWQGFDPERSGRIADILSRSMRASLGLPDPPMD